jgi:TatD DNase family protein
LDSFSEQQRARLMEQAARDEIVLMLTTGLNLETSQESVRIAEKHPSVYAGIGYHPSEAVPIDDDLYGKLKGLAASEKVAVVSEVGLDFAWQNAPAREIQEACFRRNVELAKELSLPLQLHIGDAHRQALRILEEEDAFHLGGAIHEQISNEADLDLWLQKGYYITVGLRVLRTDVNRQELSKVVERIPMERLLLETDAYGGAEQGELVGPARVKLVAQKVAEIKGVSPEEMGRATTENLRRFLRINT